MYTIKITFPVFIRPDIFIDMIQQNIKTNTDTTCIVSLLERGKEDHTYEVTSAKLGTFFQVGITAGLLLLNQDLKAINEN